MTEETNQEVSVAVENEAEDQEELVVNDPYARAGVCVSCEG